MGHGPMNAYTPHRISAPYTQERIAPAPCRPGERLLRGRVVCYDLDCLTEHLAWEAVEQAPEDLGGLSDEDLRGLRYACLRRSRYADDATRDVVLSRVMVEFSRRGWDSSSARAA